tara:strand:- start:473 stop:802 length:330 start_codon:yes stop_codon:yes gene_type:complete
MAFLNHNVTGEITKELLAPGSGVDISSVSICNVHATNQCSIDLYMEKKLKKGQSFDSSFGKFYLLKNTQLPAGVSLNHVFKINGNKFGLFIKLTKSASETPSVDVIINT